MNLIIQKKYLIYWTCLHFGIRWPNAWEFPTQPELYYAVGALLFYSVVVTILLVVNLKRK